MPSHIVSIPTDTFLTLNMSTPTPPTPKLSERTLEHIHQIRESWKPAFHPLCIYLREDGMITLKEHGEVNKILSAVSEEHYTRYYETMFDLTSFFLAESGEL